MENRVNSAKLLLAAALLTGTIPSQAMQECVEGVTTRSWSPERTVKAHECATRKGRDSLSCEVTRRGADKEPHDNKSVNVFASQGNQRAIMQMTTMAVLNRKIDDVIIDELNTGTVAIGSAATLPSVSLFQNGRVKLSNASVPWDSNVTLLCQPAFLAYLEQAPEFSSADFVNVRPYAGDDPSWRDTPQAYKWRNCLIIEHPNLPGKGTSSEKSFLYHKSAIGHAVNTGGLESPVGYDEEQAYSWARASCYMGAKVLQNTGIVVITADGSAYA